MNKMLARSALLAALAVPLAAHAEQSRQFGDFEVHYNALSSSQLTPAIARGYGIERSPQRGIVTLSVLVRKKGIVGTPVKATLTGSAVNPNQQRSDLSFREIAEHDAVYYIGEFSKTARDTIKFKVSIQTADHPKAETLEFTKEFFD